MNRKISIFRKVFMPFMILTIISFIIISFVVLHFVKGIYFDETTKDLKISAELFCKLLPENISLKNADKIQFLCESAGLETDIRITVILPDGVVIGDSKINYKNLENHGDRPEFKEALSGKTGVSKRYSYTFKTNYYYVAVPVIKNDTVTSVVRVSPPLEKLFYQLKMLELKLYITLFIVLLIMVTGSYYIADTLGKSSKDLIRGTEELNRKNLNYRIPANSIGEFDTIALNLNEFAEKTDEQIKSLIKRRNDIEIVLSGMVEAVIAVDTESRIIEYNNAAEKVLNISLENAKGKHVHEMIRNSNFLKFVKNTLASDLLIEDILSIYGDEEKTFQAHGTRIYGINGEPSGAIIVLNDISQLKKLENIRKDFVANVSHELKTPITSIIGFVETLRDGAVSDEKNRSQFLEIILKHAERLNGIIEDLLSLSRIEQEAEKGTISLENANLCEILSNALIICQNKAREKDILLHLDCAEISLKCNSTLIEQCVVNLIDNAVKYSPSKSDVFIDAVKNESSVKIVVKDNGPGIPREHLSRIFERFYRVDKGRSRALGGTGLGLAIVKHIVLAHGGNIEVESIPGKGSVFSIVIPLT